MDHEADVARILEGKIVVIGNEPFTKLAMETDSGETFVLLCPKDIEIILSKRQGQRMRLHWTSVGDAPEGRTLAVDRIEKSGSQNEE
jgi:hypothetical protein